MDGLVAVSWWLLDGKHRCVAAGLHQWGHVWRVGINVFISGCVMGFAMKSLSAR